jgi:hypothetical protein
MPFKSQSQRRKFYAMASRGEISKSTVKEWEDATPKGKKLPERVKQAAILNTLRSAIREPAVTDTLIGGGVGALGGGLYGWKRPMDPTGASIEKDPTTRDKLRGALFSGSIVGLTGLGVGAAVGGVRGIVKGERQERVAQRLRHHRNMEELKRRGEELSDELGQRLDFFTSKRLSFKKEAVARAFSSVAETPEGQRSLRRVLDTLSPQALSKLGSVIPKNLMR